jgi:SAM-dependent methyltransferase
VPSPTPETAPAGFVLRDGILVAEDHDPSPYREIWEEEARADHVVSAIARPAPDETLEQLTAKLTGVWERIPRGSELGTILDVGCGYGRLALALSRLRGVRCSRYVGVDISETMLRHLNEYRERFDVFPGAEPTLLCTSADRLPLESESVDLAVSSVVFLHMGRTFLARTLAEIVRVLKPDGRFVFEASFPNRLAPANAPAVIRSRGRERRPNQLKYYSAAEVRRLLDDAGLGSRGGGYRIEPSERALLPKAVAGRRIPLARRINAVVAQRAGRADRFLAVSFTVTSANLSPA